MRPSNRIKILEAAVRVIQRDGVTAMTFDAVAAESGLTRGGLMYHFPSREDLVRGVDDYLAAQWESAMTEALGKDPEEASADERLAAYVRVCTQSADRAELVAMLDAASDATRKADWVEIAPRWAPHPTRSPLAAGDLRRFVARLAADGMWMYESLTDQRLDEELRQQIAEHIIETFTDPGK